MSCVQNWGNKIKLLFLTTALLIQLFMAENFVIFFFSYEMLLIPFFNFLGFFGGHEKRCRAANLLLVYTACCSILLFVV